MDSEVFLFIKMWSQRAVECCLLLDRLSHEVAKSDILEMGGEGRKKRRRKKPSKALTFLQVFQRVTVRVTICCVCNPQVCQDALGLEEE